VLQKLGLWTQLRRRMVRGENIGHAFQFVNSGNAELGFVAASQVFRSDKPRTGSWWAIPKNYYSPILQQAVMLNDKKLTQAFLNFVRSAAMRQLIRDNGYETTDTRPDA
jgi:molybdate transport system substrate-binding protein